MRKSGEIYVNGLELDELIQLRDTILGYQEKKKMNSFETSDMFELYEKVFKHKQRGFHCPSCVTKVKRALTDLIDKIKERIVEISE